MKANTNIIAALTAIAAANPEGYTHNVSRAL